MSPPGQTEPYNIKENVLMRVSAALLAAVAVGSALAWTLLGGQEPIPAAVTSPAPDPAPLGGQQPIPAAVTSPVADPATLGGQQPIPTAMATAVPDPATLGWHDVASWESSSDDDGPVFRILAESWRVSWLAHRDSVGDGEFAVHIYNSDGLLVRKLYDTTDLPGMALDNPIRGNLMLSDSGDYFVRALTSRGYHFTVQELR